MTDQKESHHGQVTGDAKPLSMKKLIDKMNEISDEALNFDERLPDFKACLKRFQTEFDAVKDQFVDALMARFPLQVLVALTELLRKNDFKEESKSSWENSDVRKVADKFIDQALNDVKDDDTFFILALLRRSNHLFDVLDIVISLSKKLKKD